MTQRKYTYFPDAEHRFFVYDPEGEDFYYYATREERDARAAVVIDENNNDGWSDTVENIIVGEVTGRAMRRNVRPKPQRKDFATDDDFYDAMKEFAHPEFDYVCDYVICPIDEHDDPIPGEKQP